MKRLLSIAALAAVIAAPVQAQTVDQLLKQVESGSFQKSKSAADYEKRFRSAGAGKTALIQTLKGQRASLEARSQTLEDQFAANEKELNALRNQREAALGDLKELFGSVQQYAGEMQAGFEHSIISAQYPDRTKKLAAISKKINQSNDLLTPAELNAVWKEAFREMAEQGKVARFNAPVATASGERVEKAVTRAGVFNLVADDAFLTYGAGGLAELARQPAGRYLSQAEELATATGGTVDFSLDPTKGSLLEATVDSPSLIERVHQGGLVAYIILGVGAIAAIIAIFKIISLMGVSAAVNRQAKNPNSPSTKNPLGRVLKSVDGLSGKDPEAMELKLSEAIMKETPKLTSWLMFLKIVSVVAPLGGLLGTVLGMITTFQSITLFGAGDPKLMAGGISEALVTTVCGLVVAIPIVLLHTAAASKAKRVEEILEEQSAGMVARKMEG